MADLVGRSGLPPGCSRPLRGFCSTDSGIRTASRMRVFLPFCRSKSTLFLTGVVGMRFMGPQALASKTFQRAKVREGPMQTAPGAHGTEKRPISPAAPWLGNNPATLGRSALLRLPDLLTA